MTRYLLDTSVASVLAPGRMEKEGLDSTAASWFHRHETAMHLSTITIMEIESGIQQLVLTGASRRSSLLSTWLAGLLKTFEDRILDFDGAVAMAAGRLEAAAIAAGRHPGLADVIIAAVGQVHGLTVLTRNVRHFETLGIFAIDPFESRQPSGR